MSERTVHLSLTADDARVVAAALDLAAAAAVVTGRSLLAALHDRLAAELRDAIPADEAVQA